LIETGGKFMTLDIMLRQLEVAVAVCLVTFAGMASATSSTLDLSLPESKFYNEDAKSFLLAENDSVTFDAKKNLPAVAPAKEFEPGLFTGRKIHQYLGLGTLVLAGLTTLTAPEDGCESNCNNLSQSRPVNGTHAELAKATAVMALATVVSGLIIHWDDFNVEDGWSDPDNLHVMLGVSGAALLAYAVNKSMNVSNGQVSHAGMAELGALGMLVAVKLTW
jgi:hypothetical protein